MLLTFKPPSLQNGHLPLPNAFSPPKAHSSSLFSPVLNRAALPSLPETSSQNMSTPHRGLPPPSAMASGIQHSDRSSSITQSLGPSLGNLPAPPGQWQQGTDESMRQWLHAKSEEDRRKQEEQKTQQESYKLEQRKIEERMLRDSLQGGIPPHLVPMVFASMGGGNLTNMTLEYAQQYMAQMTLQAQQQLQQQQAQQQQAAHQQLLQEQQAQQQHQQQQHQQQHQLQQTHQAPHSSPDLRRDPRNTTGPQPNPYGPQQLPAIQGPPTQVAQGSQSGLSNAPFSTVYQLPNSTVDRSRVPPPPLQAGPPPTSAPRSSVSGSSLSRLNTVEMQIQPPPQAGLQTSSQHPLQQTQAAQQQEQSVSSPSTIYFHHWVPPASQSGPNKEPPTPSGKSAQDSPHQQNAASHLRSEYVNSPKKRKTNSNKTPETSPQFSQHSSAGRRQRAHSNARHDRPQQYDATNSSSRAQSRQRHQSTSEADSGSQRQASSRPEPRQRSSAGPEKGRRGSGSPKRERETG